MAQAAAACGGILGCRGSFLGRRPQIVRACHGTARGLDGKVVECTSAWGSPQLSFLHITANLLPPQVVPIDTNLTCTLAVHGQGRAHVEEKVGTCGVR